MDPELTAVTSVAWEQAKTAVGRYLRSGPSWRRADHDLHVTTGE